MPTHKSAHEVLLSVRKPISHDEFHAKCARAGFPMTYDAMYDVVRKYPSIYDLSFRKRKIIPLDGEEAEEARRKAERTLRVVRESNERIENEIRERKENSHLRGDPDAEDETEDESDMDDDDEKPQGVSGESGDEDGDGEERRGRSRGKRGRKPKADGEILNEVDKSDDDRAGMVGGTSADDGSGLKSTTPAG